MEEKKREREIKRETRDRNGTFKTKISQKEGRKKRERDKD